MFGSRNFIEVGNFFFYRPLTARVWHVQIVRVAAKQNKKQQELFRKPNRKIYIFHMNFNEHSSVAVNILFRHTTEDDQRVTTS